MHLKDLFGFLPSMGMSRRDFLRRTAVGVAGVGAVLAAPTMEGCTQPQPQPQPQPPPQPPAAKSRIVLVQHSGATANAKRVKEPIAQMVDACVTRMAGETDPAKAWRKFFSSDEVVGIKVNGLGGPGISTARELSEVCVERLTGIGVKPQNIIFWDCNPGYLRNCGLNPDGGDWGCQVLTKGVEYDPPLRLGSFYGRITSILTKRIDALLSLPILKDHGISGITLSMKQHYGSHENPGDHHGNNCDPYIADLNTLPAIRQKTRLIITDGTRATCEGGPGFNPQYVWSYNHLLAATDPVALDYTGWTIIEGRRKEVGLPPLAQVGRPPKHIASAAARGLGTNDPEQIEVMPVELA